MRGNDGQPTPPPSFAALARLITEGGEALTAEISRRIEETRPTIEALARQFAADGEAMAKAFGAALRAAQPKPPPVPTIEHVLDVARRLADRPQPGRIEVGTLAYAALKARFTPEGAPPENPYRSLAISTSLYGVPLMTRGSMDPDAWRLLDTDGHVIKEGTL